jgi:hypothetical protein
MMEIAGERPASPHLSRGVTFREGKLWPEALPGLGVEFDPGRRAGVRDHRTQAPIPMYRRPDGSFTNW